MICKTERKQVGISTGDFSAENLAYWRDMGVDMISAGADFDFLTLGMRNAKENMARIIKG